VERGECKTSSQQRFRKSHCETTSSGRRAEGENGEQLPTGFCFKRQAVAAWHKDLQPSDICTHALTGYYWARRLTQAQYRQRGERKKRCGVGALSASDRLIPFIVLEENDNWESYVNDFKSWDATTKAPLQKMASGSIKSATYHCKWVSFADARLKRNPKAFLKSKGNAFASVSRFKAKPWRDEFQTRAEYQGYPAASPYTAPMMGHHSQATSQVAVGGHGISAWQGYPQQCAAESRRRVAAGEGVSLGATFEASVSCFCPGL
jgi:hypothetical protein